MTKISKRDHKKLLRSKRLAILAKIDELEKLRCKFCSIDSGYSLDNKSKCDCHASAEIGKLGNQLMKLVSKRKSANVNVQASHMDFKNVTFETLTVTIYENMKHTGMTDADIYNLLRIGQVRLRNWKSANGLKGGRWRSEFD